MFYFDHDRLMQMAHSLKEQYRTADPFPHIYIDNFLPPDVLDEVLGEFPGPGSIEWQKFQNPREKKLATVVDRQMGDKTRHLLSQLNSASVCEFLEVLTGIDHIISDPHFSGGGLHQIIQGGFLKLHADFNWHAKLELHRRINLLIYVNKNWKEEYGGHLEFWDKPMEKCKARILPIFNRCAIFTTTSDSWHGNPVPLTCPEGWTRKSMALYYYTAKPPVSGGRDAHDTLFKDIPGENVANARESIGIKEFAKKLVPPIVLDMARALRPK